MEPRRQRIIQGETHPPTRRDRLIVFLVSLSCFVLLLPMAQPLHASVVGWIVMLAVIGLPMVTINVLGFEHGRNQKSEEGSKGNSFSLT